MDNVQLIRKAKDLEAHDEEMYRPRARVTTETPNHENSNPDRRHGRNERRKNTEVVLGLPNGVQKVGIMHPDSSPGSQTLMVPRTIQTPLRIFCSVLFPFVDPAMPVFKRPGSEGISVPERLISLHQREDYPRISSQG